MIGVDKCPTCAQALRGEMHCFMRNTGEPVERFYCAHEQRGELRDVQGRLVRVWYSISASQWWNEVAKLTIGTPR